MQVVDQSSLSGLLKNFDVLKTEIQEAIIFELTDAAENIENKAKAYAPKRSGKLSRDIISDVKISKGLVKAQVGTKKAKDSAYWGFFVHQGTKYIKVKQPFLIDALEDCKDEMYQNLINKINQKLRKDN